MRLKIKQGRYYFLQVERAWNNLQMVLQRTCQVQIRTGVFLLHEVPDARFKTGENAYFVADGIGKAFAGFNEHRALRENAGFFGVAFQFLVKYGTYVPESNKKAIVKGKLTIPTEPET